MTKGQRKIYEEWIDKLIDKIDIYEDKNSEDIEKLVTAKQELQTNSIDFMGTNYDLFESIAKKYNCDFNSFENRIHTHQIKKAQQKNDIILITKIGIPLVLIVVIVVVVILYSKVTLTPVIAETEQVKVEKLVIQQKQVIKKVETTPNGSTNVSVEINAEKIINSPTTINIYNDSVIEPVEVKKKHNEPVNIEKEPKNIKISEKFIHFSIIIFKLLFSIMFGIVFSLIPYWIIKWIYCLIKGYAMEYTDIEDEGFLILTIIILVLIPTLILWFYMCSWISFSVSIN